MAAGRAVKIASEAGITCWSMRWLAGMNGSNRVDRGKMTLRARTWLFHLFDASQVGSTRPLFNVNLSKYTNSFFNRVKVIFTHVG